MRGDRGGGTTAGGASRRLRRLVAWAALLAAVLHAGALPSALGAPSRPSPGTSEGVTLCAAGGGRPVSRDDAPASPAGHGRCVACLPCLGTALPPTPVVVPPAPSEAGGTRPNVLEAPDGIARSAGLPPAPRAPPLRRTA